LSRSQWMKSVHFVIALAGICAGLADDSTAAAAPEIELSPARVLLDEPVRIRVDHLLPGQLTDVSIQSDAGVGTWEAHASFRADDAGTIGLSRDAPVSGAYTGVQAMGLFFTATFARSKDPHAKALTLLDARRTVVESRIDGKIAATANLERLWIA